MDSAPETLTPNPNKIQDFQPNDGPTSVDDMTPEQIQDQINELFTKIQANFDHNCRAFRSRSSQVMQKVEELEMTLQDMLNSLQENKLECSNSETMVSLVMPDNTDIKTPSNH